MKSENQQFNQRFWFLITAALGGLLVIVLASITAGVMGYEFLNWDDNRIVYELQSRGTSTGSITAWLANTHVTNLFTPTSLLFLGIVADIFGIVPQPFHAAGILLHLLNTFLVYTLIIRLFSLMPSTSRQPSLPLLQLLAATAAAGLWGMHPLRAQVIGWVAAIPYALSTALALLALHAFIGTRNAPTARIGGWLSLVLYSLSILAHPQAAPLCFVFLALDYLLAQHASPITRIKDSAIYWIRRNAAFFAIGMIVMLIGIVTRSHDPNRPVKLLIDSFDTALGELAKLLGFASDFSLFHAWLPRQIPVVYIGYGITDLLSFTVWASTLSLVMLMFVAARRGIAGKKGLLAALLCHLAFCIPASGLFLPNYLPSDRFIYGLTIIATVVFAFALRSVGEFVARRLNPPVLVHILSVCFTIALLFVSSLALAAVLPRWQNTHTLMVRLQQTAPSQNWRFFAKLRDTDYWREKGNTPQLKLALLGFLDAPKGSEGETMVAAVQFLTLNGRCEYARYLVKAANAQLVISNAAQLDITLRYCSDNAERKLPVSH